MGCPVPSPSGLSLSSFVVDQNCRKLRRVQMILPMEIQTVSSGNAADDCPRTGSCAPLFSELSAAFLMARVCVCLASLSTCDILLGPSLIAQRDEIIDMCYFHICPRGLIGPLKQLWVATKLCSCKGMRRSWVSLHLAFLGWDNPCFLPVSEPQGTCIFKTQNKIFCLNYSHYRAPGGLSWLGVCRGLSS